jgi:SAM-dependent methyltransferase
MGIEKADERNDGASQRMEDWPLWFKALSPVRALMKRWGTKWMKQAAWEAEFRRGHNLHKVSRSYRSAICVVVEQYSRGGDILDLGCSDGHIGLGLNTDAYHTYTGVDISKIATDVAFAKVRSIAPERAHRNKFCVHDIGRWTPSDPLDVILFKDSIYYLPKSDLRESLSHYSRYLKEGGVFIVQMDNIQRHGWIRAYIRENFKMIEDRESVEADHMTLVFRPVGK